MLFMDSIASKRLPPTSPSLIFYQPPTGGSPSTALVGDRSIAIHGGSSWTNAQISTGLSRYQMARQLTFFKWAPPRKTRRTAIFTYVLFCTYPHYLEPYHGTSQKHVTYRAAYPLLQRKHPTMQTLHKCIELNVFHRCYGLEGSTYSNKASKNRVKLHSEMHRYNTSSHTIFEPR